MCFTPYGASIKHVHPEEEGSAKAFGGEVVGDKAYARIGEWCGRS